MIKKFYSAPLYALTTTGYTETIEQTITLSSAGSVLINLPNIPTYINKICVYRSDTSDNETFLFEYELTSLIRDKRNLGFSLTLTDDGSDTPTLEPYPNSTPLTLDEQKAIPVPIYTLDTSVDGSLPADTYYYRVAYYISEKNVAPKFISNYVEPLFYLPDLSAVLSYTSLDLESLAGSEFTEVIDIYSYIDTFYADVILSSALINGVVTPQQELILGSFVLKKTILGSIPVLLTASARSVPVNVPVTLAVDPPYVELEILENVLVGTPEILSDVSLRVYADAGSVNLYASPRCRFLYSFSAPFFKVV